MEQYRSDIAAHLSAERADWHVFDCVDSTNLLCKRQAMDGAADGFAAIADRQTAGRGRLGRSFQSPGGLGLYLSILWHPGCDARALLPLPALGAVAAKRAVERVCGLGCAIKWPNDLVAGGKKVGGILTESVVLGGEMAVVLGIGINVSHTPSDFEGEVRDIAASLQMVTGKPVSRAALAAALMEQLHELRCCAMERPELWLEEYRSRCLTVGREVRVITPQGEKTARALAVEQDYGLSVCYEDGSVETVRAGEVSVRGLYGYV
jgi:BirA family biotin operon repressor/biotin-[acetyl-CoA-carboxylase] ligase